MEKQKLTQEEYEKKLSEIHNKKIFKRKWDNYPNSFFYYDRPNVDGTTQNIGIYTNKTCYSLESA
jgi:hypothetical protein